MPDAIGKIITRAQDLSDWPTTPDARYLKIADAAATYVELAGDTMTGSLYTTGPLRTRQFTDTRYRGEFVVLAGTAVLNSYDDTGAVYQPMNIDFSALHLRPNANSANELYFDANGFGAWTPFTSIYTNSGGTTWADFGGAYTVPGYRRIGDMVQLRGVCKRTAGAGNVVATLPSGFRPTAGREANPCVGNGAFAQIDIYTDGTINIAVGSGSSSLTFNGIMFSVI